MNREIKRYISLVFFFLTIIFALSIETIAEEYYETDEPMKYAVGQQCLWIVENDKISYASLQGEKRQFIDILTAKNITHIAADENYFYFLTEADACQKLTGIDKEGVIISQIEIPTELKISQIEAYNSMVYILGTYDEVLQDKPDEHAHQQASFSVYQCDPQLVNSIKLLQAYEWLNEDISFISVYGGYLYTYSNANQEACLIDLGDCNLKYPAISLSNIAYITAADTNNGVHYMYALSHSEQTSIWHINMMTGEKNALSTVVPSYCIGLRRSNDYLFTLGNQAKTLYALPMEDQYNEPSTSITIVNSLREDSPRMQKAISLFHEEYPDVDVLFRYVDDPRVLSTAVMAGSDGYDIICMQEQVAVICSPMLYKAGALENLKTYDSIASLLPEFLDLFDMVSINGDMYGVPEFIFPYVWEVNQSLAEELDFHIPSMGWTWLDFFELAQKVQEYNTKNGTQIVLLDDTGALPYFLVQYNTNTVDIHSGSASYVNTDFIALLKEWVAYRTSGIIIDSVDDEQIVPEDNILMKVCSTDYYGMGTRNLILPPTFNSSTKYPVEVVSLVLSSNSTNKDAAAFFLACYLAPESLLTQPIDDQGQWLNDLSRYTRFDIKISEENEKLWTKILENGVQDYFIGDLHRDQRKILYPQLLCGDITAEQYADICQQRADMVLGE